MKQGKTAGGREGKRRRTGRCLSALLPCLSAFLPFCVFALPLTSAACHRAHAKTLPENPPLEVPAVPPREVGPIEVETPQPMPLPEEPARTPPPRLRPPAPVQPPRAEPPKSEPPKTEQPPVEAPKPEEEPAKPPALLQTTPPNTEGDLERGIRATLMRAQTDLNRIDAARLNADARVQYETAKSFIRQAEQAVRAKNLLFAKSVADKAAVLAAQLAPK
jgi:hypothetical protein